MDKKLVTLIAVLLLAVSLAARAGEVIDRIVATVNGHVVLQSDWEDALRYEAFLNGRTLDRLSSKERKAALDRLIDQELLREQMRATDSQYVSPEAVNKRIEEVRNQYPGADTDAGWRAALAGYGLSEEGLKRHISAQLDLMRLVDSRLRPTVSIDSKSIESYYNQELLPQLRQSGAKDVALAEVTPRIKEVLTQQKMNQLLNAWLQDLRAVSEIHTQALVPDSGARAQ